MFLHLSVGHSVQSGVSSRHHLPGQTTPLGRHPPEQTPLPSACWDTHTPAQCMLVYITPLAATAADGTHATGMHSCILLQTFYRNALVNINLMFKHLQDFVGGKGVNMIVEMRADSNMGNDVKLLAKFGRVMVCKL